ncbi:hypothetical protein BU16DRAFT_163110 [Lophium mytilinum]|uniref:C2H2-type domain-containing protein n=1 Tax=Lophium mytilinum TaxID=390894 RepID=A0A6A6QCA6_9PEZI|nr:hypothetical protein BU16DRAFT_163110 [Lophium mytilinum]
MSFGTDRFGATKSPYPRASSARNSSSSVESARSAFSQSKDAVWKISKNRGSKKYSRATLRRQDESQDVIPGRFQCTFCSKILSEKTWKRHEETQHLPRWKWICTTNFKHFTGVVTCVICLKLDPDHEHCRTAHPELAKCFEASEEDRTFYRKDHLAQHIQNVHGRKLYEAPASYLKVDIDDSEQTWTCGFCGEELVTWALRARHIAAHFRQGVNMTQWDSNRQKDG